MHVKIANDFTDIFRNLDEIVTGAINPTVIFAYQRDTVDDPPRPHSVLMPSRGECAGMWIFEPAKAGAITYGNVASNDIISFGWRAGSCGIQRRKRGDSLLRSSAYLAVVCPACGRAASADLRRLSANPQSVLRCPGCGTTHSEAEAVRVALRHASEQKPGSEE